MEGVGLAVPTCPKEQSAQQQVHAAGGRLRRLAIHDAVSVDDDTRVQAKRALAQKVHPSEDPDLRFPMIDLRQKTMGSTPVGNRNLLRMHCAVERLWGDLEAAETADGGPYDYVMFLRDDTQWLEDFDLDRLLAEGQADAYVLGCDAREPPLLPMEINDHGAVATRANAGFFGRYFSFLLNHTDPKACQRTLPAMYKKNDERGCNSEMLLSYNLARAEVRVRKVGQRIIPLQRSVHVVDTVALGGVGGSRPSAPPHTTVCFHKYCQSKLHRLADHGMQQCSSPGSPRAPPPEALSLSLSL